MKQNKRIVAIIPARGGSKGIPKKNIMDFCGKPLIAWTIQQALGSAYIDEVYVSSDDADILRISKKFGAKGIVRPRSLARDTSSTEDALIHALSSISGDVSIVVFLQATSPLRTASDIDKAIETFFSKKADSLFSAALLDDCCLWKKNNRKLESFSFDYKNRGRRQEREPLFLENGSIYIFKPGVLKKYHNRLGGSIACYIMDYWKSYEIDKKEDLEICRYYMKRYITDRNRG